ncbi:hypothetical protein [Streptosporangium sp. NBC_01469]|uniref:hypothetical protein n=1 Tax=Streptosporangium sp. NBC_01469 TaxID=2903898 RepID=UPI002E299E15|nr:hypothetical protein [Streptosporangium sp. NBC_01469]
MTTKIPPTHPVTPGSIWRDRRDLFGSRTLRVERIENGRAVCVTLTNSYEVQRQLTLAAKRPQDSPLHNTRDMRGSTTRILLDRFRPTAHGLDLITADAETPNRTSSPNRPVRDAAPTPPRTVAAPRNPATINQHEVTSS